jgi:hypothetical protein
MPKPKKTLQEIIDEMRDLQAHEDDLLDEMEANMGSLISDDLEDIDEENL